MSHLDEPHWSALAPSSPLRRWRLVEPEPGEPLATAPLRIDEPILHRLLGVDAPDPRLDGLTLPVAGPGALTPGQEKCARGLVAAWARTPSGERPPVVQLVGPVADDKRAFAQRAVAAVGLGLHVARAERLPPGPAEAESFARAWEREAALSGLALLVEADDASPPEALATATRLALRLRAPLLLAAPDVLPLRDVPTLLADVPWPAQDEARDAWRRLLGPRAGLAGERLEEIVAQFTLSAAGIALAARAALAQAPPEADARALGDALWDACRARTRERLDDLAQRVDCRAGWDDLVLPPAQTEALRAFVSQVRHRALVHGTWGFADRASRGLGVHALFSGESGTGKTMAAEVVARELGLDLYRVDLSQVVSKYIGETEKHVRRLFDAAERGATILLFDEADALFGKRSEVRDSHDRHANVEVGYLLQRIEAYRGVCILTTNLKETLDPAFLRRFRTAVAFPLPDEDTRERLWRGAIPPRAPREGVDPRLLARAQLTGGNIRNAALQAAFLAADAGEPIRMDHLLRAARAEASKSGRPLTGSETRGWT